MRIAHLILTHKSPSQLERLINALEHPKFYFFIHIDKKTNIEPFQYLAQRPNVYFINNRTKIYWAGYGTIQATINGFEEIRPSSFDYINVISGQDFPIKSPDYIYNYFNQNKGKEFITCQSIDDVNWNVGDRVRKYHLINWRIPGKFRLERIVNSFLPLRKYPIDHQIVGRANWFTLSNKAFIYILDFIRQHPKIVRYYKYCWGADEFMFSTILYNSDFREHIVDNLVYVDWPELHSGHPKILEKNDYKNLTESDKLFARKIDIDKDAEIVAMLEKWIQSSRGN